MTGKTLSTRWVDQKLNFAIRTQDPNGTVMELADIEEGRPPKDLFQPPKGYPELYFPPPPLNRFEEFLTTILPQARLPFSAELTIERPLLMNKRASVYFDGKNAALEVSRYVVQDHDHGRVRYVLNYRSKEFLRTKLDRAGEFTDPRFSPCASYPDLKCEKSASEKQNERLTQKWVFRNKTTGEWFATVWDDDHLQFPIHAVTSEGTVFDTDAVREGAPERAAFKLPSDYKEVGAVAKLQATCGLVNAPVPCTVK